MHNNRVYDLSLKEMANTRHQNILSLSVNLHLFVKNTIIKTNKIKKPDSFFQKCVNNLNTNLLLII